MKTITIDRLREAGACDEGVAKFLERWPAGWVEVTVEKAVAHAADFDWLWAQEHLLTAEAKRACDAAIAEARRAYAAAMKEPRKAYAAAKAEAFARAYIEQEGNRE